MTTKSEDIIRFLGKNFPNASCTLDFHNAYECVVAVMLSAQTSDASVNKVTPTLFSFYPDPSSLAKAKIEDIEAIISKLGLYHNKAKNLLAMAKIVVERFGGEMPLYFDSLVSLPGVGVKTANVSLMELNGRPSFAVDTHVGRIYKRLGYAKENDEALTVEKKLEKAFPKERWIDLHHQSIAFGRNICKAIGPLCERCELHAHCRYFKKTSSTRGK
ncbi:MAG: endonuclease III [Bacilli bacterium]|nr:endonuclease III [Bacilli bacterium]